MIWTILWLGLASAPVTEPPGPIEIAPADNAAVSEATAPASDRDNGSLVAAKTVVQIAISEAISSKTNKIGDTFALTLAEPLAVDGHEVLPAGLSGRGEVTHAAKRGWGGKAGELIVNARYLECGELRIPLGYFQYVDTGTSNFGGALATAQIIPLGQFLVSGGEASIPAGTRGTAKVKADVLVPRDAITACGSHAGKVHEGGEL